MSVYLYFGNIKILLMIVAGAEVNDQIVQNKCVLEGR
jgi:hypothetical protein